MLRRDGNLRPIVKASFLRFVDIGLQLGELVRHPFDIVQ